MMALMSISRAADEWGYSVRHFRRLLYEHKIRIIPMGKGGKKYFVLSEDLEPLRKKRGLDDKLSEHN